MNPFRGKKLNEVFEFQHLSLYVSLFRMKVTKALIKTLDLGYSLGIENVNSDTEPSFKAFSLPHTFSLAQDPLE